MGRRWIQAISITNDRDTNDFPKHLHTLDILRGLASLAVVLYHYQHFYYVAPGELAPGFVWYALPLYSLLWPFYQWGFLAVKVFFVLSGFVFYFIYCDAIATKVVSAYNFMILRFSRLYPLHFATLIFVAIMQFGAHPHRQSFVVYPFNDVYHFLLNLFFVSHWGVEYGYSFNGPTWTVSVEILLYAAFFVLIFTAGRNLVAALAAMLAGLFMATQLQGSFCDTAWGFYCFFAGGISCLVWTHFRRWFGPFWLLLWTLLALALALSALAFSYTRFGYSTLAKAVLYGGCFPAVVLLLATMQGIKPDLGRSLRVIGDITYATYLLHFPVQLVIVYVAAYYSIAIDYGHPSTVVMFLVIVIVISIPTFYFFERPAQAFCRDRFIRPPRINARAPTSTDDRNDTVTVRATTHSAAGGGC